MYNKSLLKETRKVCRQLNYQFIGYTVNGQDETEKKSEENKFITIESMHDVTKLS